MRLIIALVLLLLSLLASYAFYTGQTNSKAASIDEFLQQHWQRPLALQGLPPEQFSELEASLEPQSCGQCHQQQYRDWQQSLHSKTMGAGISWQLPLMNQSEANTCLECHAPLAEQKALVAIRQQWPNAPQSAPPAYIGENLDQSGLVCAACHVRQHQRFGPPARTSDITPAHSGFTESEAFSDSRFCSSCHQFPEDGGRTAGKLRENTYQEWLASPYAEQGVQCQSCHMPDRRHQWQGIHSADMVKKAVSSNLQIENNTIKASLSNTGAGHLFPTYLIPKVHLQLVEITATKEQLLTEKIIGWQVSDDLQEEIFDTRLAPFETVHIEFDLSQLSSQHFTIELRLLVDPDQHYRRTFELSSAQAKEVGNVDVKILQQLQQALIATQNSSFTLVLEKLDDQY